MRQIIQNRLLEFSLRNRRSGFLWGPRRTGKSYLIHQRFPDAILIDLLKTDVFAEYRP